MPVSTPVGSASVVATTLSVVPPPGGPMSIQRKSTFTSASNRVSKPSSSKSRFVASWSDTAMATVEIPVSVAVCVVMNGRQFRSPGLIGAAPVTRPHLSGRPGDGPAALAWPVLLSTRTTQLASSLPCYGTPAHRLRAVIPPRTREPAGTTGVLGWSHGQLQWRRRLTTPESEPRRGGRSRPNLRTDRRPVPTTALDGNDNLSEAPAGQRVHGVGDVFRMTTTKGNVRENHVVEFVEGQRIAWTPAEPGQEAPGHLWR